MNGVLIDINVQGLFAHILHLLTALDLIDFWSERGFAVHTVPGLGYPRDVSDRILWNRCQADGLVLFTENRTADDRDALERTIADSLTSESLPVLTIANKWRFQNDRRYALIVAEQFLNTILDIDGGRLSGVGRMFLPPRPVV